MSTYHKIQNKEYIPDEWENVNCPICGSSEKELYERFGNRWQYTHTLCLDCNLIYCSPRPAFNDEFLFHAYEFYADDTGNLTLDYESKLNKHFKGVDKDLKDIIAFDKSADSFLDVGCETGTYLYAAKKYFKNVYGLEISKKMADYAQANLKVKVFNEKFENLNKGIKFSCIHLSHVIEHFPDPHLWLRKARELLKPNGIVVIKVPHMLSPDRRFKVFLKNIGLRKGKWASWRTPDHLFEPTIPSMAKTFFYE